MRITTTKQPIFAYLRQSTVNKQEVSIENQYDDISDIAEREGYSIPDILDYKEKRSAWERGNKNPRKEFARMLSDIDKLKTPCVLLARNSSRLARNMEDGMELIYRLKGIHGRKQNIEKIIFADNRAYWDIDTRQSTMQNDFAKNFGESEETSRGVKDGYMKAIKAQAYPYGRDNLPKGLVLTRVSGRNYVTPTTELIYVIDAFRMRDQGETHKEISKYLAQHGILITPRSVMKNLFASKIYIGILEIKGGKQYPIKFYIDGKLSAEPLIPILLWRNVQEKSGKKHSIHGEKHKNNTLPVKTESGLVMSKGVTKDNAYYNNSAEKLNIAEWRVIQGYLEYMKNIFLGRRGLIKSIVEDEYVKEKKRITQSLGRNGISVIYEGNDIVFSGINPNKLDHVELVRDLLLNEATYALVTSNNGSDVILQVQETQEYIDKESARSIQLDVEESLVSKLEDTRKRRMSSIKALNEALTENENARKRTIYLFTHGEQIKKTEYDMSLEMVNQEEKRIKSELIELEKGGELDEYLRKIPSLLLKILELLGSAIYKREIKQLDGDIKALIKITVLELVVTSKKELKVKLFDTLQNIFLRESLYGAQEETGTLTPNGNGF